MLLKKQKEGENMKKEKENRNIENKGNLENTEKTNSDNMDIKENTENTEISVNTELEKQYMEIQKEISEKSKKGDFQGIVNLLKEKEEIIQKYQEIEKKKEEEKKQKLQEIENKIQDRIKQIDLIKEEIRNLKEEKKKIQGYNMDNSNSKTRIINREYHEYTWNSIKENKAIDIIFDILKEYNITENSWKEFNKKHSISWHYFIELTQKGKYQQKNNLLELFNNNMDNLNDFYKKVKEISVN
jgi:hypothetical protein